MKLKLHKVKEKSVFRFLTLNNEEILIGDFKAKEFKPQILLSRWDGECFLKIPLGETVKNFRYEESENYITWDSTDFKVKVYPLNKTEIKEKIQNQELKFIQNEYGGLELEIILEKRPSTNKITLPIQTQNLRFTYQPPLHPDHPTWADEDGDGKPDNFRPMNVVGSYAVYHSKRSAFHHSKENAQKYKTGKAFHIYRPKAIDSIGREIWCNLHIDEKKGLLTITIPQEFLENAVYPIYIDPNFGYESVGGSSLQIDSWECIHTYPFECPGNGTAQTLTVYYSVVGEEGTAYCFVIYNSSNRIDYTEEPFTCMGAEWWEFDLLENADLSAQTYYLGIYKNAVSDEGFYWYYDTDTSNNNYYENRTYSYPPPTTWSPTSNYNRKFSIYCTYTATFEQTCSQTLNIFSSLGKTSLLKKIEDVNLSSLFKKTPIPKKKESLNLFSEIVESSSLVNLENLYLGFFSSEDFSGQDFIIGDEVFNTLKSVKAELLSTLDTFSSKLNFVKTWVESLTLCEKHLIRQWKTFLETFSLVDCFGRRASQTLYEILTFSYSLLSSLKHKLDESMTFLESLIRTRRFSFFELLSLTSSLREKALKSFQLSLQFFEKPKFSLSAKWKESINLGHYLLKRTKLLTKELLSSQEQLFKSSKKILSAFLSSSSILSFGFTKCLELFLTVSDFLQIRITHFLLDTFALQDNLSSLREFYRSLLETLHLDSWFTYYLILRRVYIEPLHLTSKILERIMKNIQSFISLVSSFTFSDLKSLSESFLLMSKTFVSSTKSLFQGLSLTKILKLKFSFTRKETLVLEGLVEAVIPIIKKLLQEAISLGSLLSTFLNKPKTETINLHDSFQKGTSLLKKEILYLSSKLLRVFTKKLEPQIFALSDTLTSSVSKVLATVVSFTGKVLSFYFIRNLQEELDFYSLLKNGLTLLKNEVTYLFDLLKKEGTFKRAFFENLNFLSTITKAIRSLKEEFLKITELKTLIFSTCFLESFVLIDTLAKFFKFMHTETLLLLSGISKSLNRFLFETLDFLGMSFSFLWRNLQEVFIVFEELTKRFVILKKEISSLMSKVVKAFSFSRKETLSVFSVISKALLAKESESLSLLWSSSLHMLKSNFEILETLSSLDRTYEAFRNFYETLNLSEQIKKAFVRILSIFEELKLSSFLMFSTEFLRTLFESLLITEGIEFFFEKMIKSALTFISDHKTILTKVISHEFHLFTKIWFNVKLKKNEIIHYLASLSRKVSFKRIFTELQSLFDTVQAGPALHIETYEILSLIDSFLRTISYRRKVIEALSVAEHLKKMLKLRTFEVLTLKIFRSHIPKKGLKEFLTFFSVSKQRLISLIQESLVLSSTFLRTVTYLRTYYSSLNLLDQLQSLLKRVKILLETFNLSPITSSLSKKSVFQFLNMKEKLSKVSKILTSSSLKFWILLKKNVQVQKKESLMFIISFLRYNKKVLSEVVVFLGKTLKKYSVTFLEAKQLITKLQMTFKKRINLLISLSPKIQTYPAFIRFLTETLKIKSKFLSNVRFKRLLEEAIKLLDYGTPEKMIIYSVYVFIKLKPYYKVKTLLKSSYQIKTVLKKIYKAIAKGEE